MVCYLSPVNFGSLRFATTQAPVDSSSVILNLFQDLVDSGSGPEWQIINMKKYLQVITSTFDEIATYRFNFAMWRLRTVLQLLTIYFLWLTVTPENGELFGYSRQLILTYVLGAALISSIVISTRTQEIGENKLTVDIQRAPHFQALLLTIKSISSKAVALSGVSTSQN